MRRMPPESLLVRDVLDDARLHAQIATWLGRAGEPPLPGTLEFLQDLRRRPLVPGQISHQDAAFLTAFVSLIQPGAVVEIGTASGVSAAVILAAMARSLRARGRAPRDLIFHTIDRKETCLYDPTAPIGCNIAALVPELGAQAQVHVRVDSFALGQLVGKVLFDFAFVDGNHQHPWPLFDVLNLLPRLRDGAWILLHDVRLREIAASGQAAPDGPGFFGVEGAEILFRNWPGATAEGDNVGAVQLPNERKALRPLVDLLSQREFETSPTSWRNNRRQLAQAVTAAFR